jgi:hypothetical protein
MQWPLTSQSHGSVSQREQFFFVTDLTPRELEISMGLRIADKDINDQDT